MEKIRLLLLEMQGLREAIEDGKEVLKPLEDRYDQLRLKEIPEAMAEADARTITFEGIGRLQLTGDVFASIPADQRERAHAWLTDNGYGDLVMPTVHPSTLKAFAKEQLREGVELPEDLFKVTPFTRASLVKGKA